MSSIHHIIVKGLVQGVGFRPFVYRLAQAYKLNGEVSNSNTGVEIIIQGEKQKIDEFCEALYQKSPPNSKIENLNIKSLSKSEFKYNKFEITESKEDEKKNTQILPDLNLCSDCKEELLDPSDRRYLYPFITCTNCGPRFTIIDDIPYDRDKTAMRDFEMCSTCTEEYSQPENRRFHSQTNSCFNCGPQLTLYNSDGAELFSSSSSTKSKKLFQKIASLLDLGKILAIKDNGGFHLCCNALDEEAVEKLRSIKRRPRKPFGLMFPSINSIKQYCHVSPSEKELLKQAARPLVILEQKSSQNLPHNLAPKRDDLAVMLPYNPVHTLIFEFNELPLVMTSANLSEEPIITENQRCFEKLRDQVDYFCMHNREIVNRCDDSVYRIYEKENYPIRRSRGYVPENISIDRDIEKPVLACGGQRKNTFAMGKKNKIWLSQHIGGLQNLETFKYYKHSLKKFKITLDINPKVVVYDKHPNYLSSNYAREKAEKKGVQGISAQHHHAHAVSCMAENGLSGPVLAIILDGTGYGSDGKIWGGEILLTNYSGYDRIGHLDYMNMPGGEAAIKNPYRIALGYLYSIYGEKLVEMKLPSSLEYQKTDIVLEMLQNDINLVQTSSCGRLFDAVAAIADIRGKINYEAQAAIELEAKIKQEIVVEERYSIYLKQEQEGFVIKWDKLVKEVLQEAEDGIPSAKIAVKFHNSLAYIFKEAAHFARHETGQNQIVLSGGAFMNMYLLKKLKKLLNKDGFEVYWHKKVPPNDGGLSLGQVMIGNAKRKEE